MRESSPAPRGAARYRGLGLLGLTALFVVAKVMAHDYWAVAFGLGVLSVTLLSPESSDDQEPWRKHALRVVSACFVVVTLASIWTSLSVRAP
jgi:hypothetical protein